MEQSQSIIALNQKELELIEYSLFVIAKGQDSEIVNLHKKLAESLNKLKLRVNEPISQGEEIIILVATLKRLIRSALPYAIPSTSLKLNIKEAKKILTKYEE